MRRAKETRDKSEQESCLRESLRLVDLTSRSLLTLQIVLQGHKEHRDPQAQGDLQGLQGSALRQW